MNHDESTQDRLEVRDLDKIREISPPGSHNALFSFGKLLVFGAACFAAGMWTGSSHESKSIETIRQAEALPVLFAERGLDRTRQPMFSIVAIPKRARVIFAGAQVAHRRNVVAVPMPVVNKKTNIRKNKETAVTPPKKVDKTGVQQKRPVPQRAVHGFYALQIRAFKDMDEARTFIHGLKAQGYSLWTEKYRDQAGTVWLRVFVGRFKNRARAIRFRARFRRMQSIDGLVVLKRKNRHATATH